ncbi:MAG TPA: LuxR C-terminal-related transcriptional regulator, partial [Longimicrobiales bacterium]|nr:LuxR C-terminal-related transcriptional regulator [Longimicrobiales bacterium]
ARARLLPALVEALLEAGEVDDAARACAALEELAGRCAPGVMEAMVTQARGSVALAQGEPATALPLLRTAWRAWSAFGAPYEAARARMLLARACRALGDEEGARLELDGARAELERLGARPDLARLDALAGSDGGRDDHGLTRRELEVIALLATGRTNRQVAEVLSISEKTVARHVANIFLKLGVSTRAAATAYAWEHGLVSPPT